MLPLQLGEFVNGTRAETFTLRALVEVILTFVTGDGGLLRLGGDSRANPDQPILVTGDSPTQEDQVFVGVNTNDFQVLDRDTGIAHLAGVLLTLPDLGGISAGPNGSRVAKIFMGPVGSFLDRKAVPLHHTLKTPSFRGSNCVHTLPTLKMICFKNLADLEFRRLLFGNATFSQMAHRVEARLHKVTGFRLIEQFRSALAKSKLHRRIAVWMMYSNFRLNAIRNDRHPSCR